MDELNNKFDQSLRDQLESEKFEYKEAYWAEAAATSTESPLPLTTNFEFCDPSSFKNAVGGQMTGEEYIFPSSPIVF